MMDNIVYEKCFRIGRQVGLGNPQFVVVSYTAQNIRVCPYQCPSKQTCIVPIYEY